MLAADAAAHAAGLRVGMPASKAQALVQGLVIQDADPAADAEALERLAFWMLQRVAPIVAADPPDGIVIDSTGADHLHGGEAATLAILVEKLTGVGLRARATIADTWGAAHALARFDARPGFVSVPGNAARDIAPLPIAALRLASDMVRGLRVLGFDSVGDVLAQPRAPLALRFGPELGRRLDQATGRLAEPIEAIRPEALIEVRRAFAEPIAAAQTVARYIGKLATQLCDALERRGLGARKLDLICQRVDSRAQAIRVGTGLPLRDAKRMTRARKGSKRWRYYVSQAALQGDKSKAGSIPRVPAANIETLVTEALSKLFPGRAASQTDVRHLIDRVVIGRATIRIQLSDVAEGTDSARILTLPWTRSSPYRTREIIQGANDEKTYARPMPANARAILIEALRDAHRWLDELLSDPRLTLESLASRQGKTMRSIRMTLSLAFLAPEIVRAAVEGRLPRGFGLKRLVNLPMAWPDQWRALGLQAPAKERSALI